MARTTGDHQKFQASDRPSNLRDLQSVSAESRMDFWAPLLKMQIRDRGERAELTAPGIV